ncbi:hypothetical protein Trydic_g13109 [Trypoxylus dichotomus]
MPRDRDKFRKYESGFDKQKKKVKRDKFLESQTGAFVKFLKPIGEEVDDHHVTQTHDDVSNEITPSTSVGQTTVGSISIDATPAPVKTISRTTESCNPLNLTGGFELLPDAYDPVLWSNLLTHSQFDEIIEKGPLQGNDTGSQLANEGYSGWAHLRRALDNHEKSAIHGQNVGKWTDCEIRLAESSSIDKQHMKVKEEIVSDIKAAKFFSVLLDCTPDLNHQEQLSLVIRFVKTENNVSVTKNKSGGVTVEEHFLEFLDVTSTTGKNLTDVLLEELDKIGLEIKDCKGQGYDNGSNMKGSYSAVQAPILDI